MTPDPPKPWTPPPELLAKQQIDEERVKRVGFVELMKKLLGCTD